MEMTERIEAVASQNYPAADGLFSRGLRIKGQWFNLIGTAEGIQKTIEGLGRGDALKVEYHVDKDTGRNIIDSMSLVEKAREETDREDMVDFGTLLKIAHEKGLAGICTRPLTIDTKEEIAIFEATSTFKNENGSASYTAHGDAMPRVKGNIQNDNIRGHYIRLAETRAVARTLRFALGASVSKEEVGTNE